MESLKEKILKKVTFNPLGWGVFKSNDNPEKTPRASVRLKNGDTIQKNFINHSFTSHPNLNIRNGGFKIVVTESEATFWNNFHIPNRFVYFEEEDGDSYFNLFSDEVGGGSMTSLRLQTRSVYDCHVIMVRTKIVVNGREYFLLGLMHSNSGILPDLMGENEDENTRIFSRWQETMSLLRDIKSTSIQVEEKYHPVDQFVFSEFIIKVLKAKKIFEKQIEKMSVPNISPNIPRVINRTKRIKNEVFLRELGEETLELAIATCQPYKLNRKESFRKILENHEIIDDNNLFQNFYYSSQRNVFVESSESIPSTQCINVCLFPYGRSQISLFQSTEEIQADNKKFDGTYSREANREMVFEFKTELSSKIEELSEKIVGIGDRMEKTDKNIVGIGDRMEKTDKNIVGLSEKVVFIYDYILKKKDEEEAEKKNQNQIEGSEDEKGGENNITGKKRKREEDDEEEEEHEEEDGENQEISKKRKLDNEVKKDKKE